MKQDDYFLMDKYLANELDAKEKAFFESKLSSDNEFKKSFTIYKEIQNTLENRIGNKDSENALRNTLKSLSEKHIKAPKKEVKVRTLNQYTKFLVAASLVLFFSVLWLNNKKPKYSDYNNFEAIELTVRGDNSENLLKAEKAFNTKNYKEAASLLKKIVKEDPSNINNQLYLAFSLMEEDKLPEAKEILIKIKQGNSIYKNKAIWYLAILELKNKDYQASKMYLKQIPKDAVEYEIAKKLLKKL